MKIKKRLDVLLVERMYADTRSKAQAIIMSGQAFPFRDLTEASFLVQLQTTTSCRL